MKRSIRKLAKVFVPLGTRRFHVTLTALGTYAYCCELHPVGMNGTITVLPAQEAGA